MKLTFRLKHAFALNAQWHLLRDRNCADRSSGQSPQHHMLLPHVAVVQLVLRCFMLHTSSPPIRLQTAHPLVLTGWLRPCCFSLSQTDRRRLSLGEDDVISLASARLTDQADTHCHSSRRRVRLSFVPVCWCACHEAQRVQLRSRCD